MNLDKTEQAALDAFANEERGEAFSSEGESWIFFTLLSLQEVGRLIRQARLSAEVATAEGAAALERRIDAHMRAAVEAFCSDATFVDEGGSVPDDGLAVVVDAIDGMNSFRAHSERCATAMTVFRDGAPLASAILNSATGELGYADEDGARLLQLGLFGDGPVARPLPLVPSSADKPLLVNLHPFAQARPFHHDFYASWARGRHKIGVITATGGSPSWAILEAVKGHFVYINIWGGGEAQAHDLAPGMHILRAAGGAMVAVDGEPIPWIGHKGLFVAGAHEAEVSRALEVAQVAKANLDSLYGLL